MNTLLSEDKKFEEPAVYKAKHFHAEVISKQRQLASESGIKWKLSSTLVRSECKWCNIYTKEIR